MPKQSSEETINLTVFCRQWKRIFDARLYLPHKRVKSCNLTWHRDEEGLSDNKNLETDNKYSTDNEQLESGIESRNNNKNEFSCSDSDNLSSTL